MQKLACLSLDRTPAAEVLAGTAGAWLEALTEGLEWDERADADRMRRAFVKLARVSRRWPSVPDFMDAMPPREPVKALAKEHRPATAAQVAAHVATIREALGTVVEPMPAAKVERETTPEQRDRIDADLRAHYGTDRKTAAAGGDA